MASCINCKKPLKSGYVLCAQCSEEFTALHYFIGRLAEELVAGGNVNSCHLCAMKDCAGQTNKTTCVNAVKAWLLSRATEYGKEENRCG